MNKVIPNNTKPNGSNFHSSGLRQKIDQLMNILWAGGVNNPMDAIEQVSYLIFLRLLTERDEQYAKLSKKYERVFSGKWSKYAWGNFVTLSSYSLFDAVRDALENLHELPSLSSTGKLLFSRATLKIYDRPTLRAMIQAIHALDLETHEGIDLKGDMYEYLLGKLSISGRNGQFRTPRHIIDMIVALVDPKAGQRICDPACGTAGFLVSAYNRILNEKRGTGKQNYPGGGLTPKQWQFLEEQAFNGYDNDSNMVKFAIMNLYLHRLPKANVEFHNPLTTPGPKSGGRYPGTMFDVILANPPFAGKVQDESILEDLNAGLNTRATELLFLKWFLDHLAPGGRAGVIVPNGVLFGSNKATRKVRELLLKEFDLQAVIGLPSGVFKPYSGVGTAALIFERPAQKPKNEFLTKSVWFYDLTADGFTLDDKRTPIEANDIPDILAKWPKREESARSFVADIHRLAQVEYSLVSSRYRFAEAASAEHEEPVAILQNIRSIETKIVEGLDDLIKQVKQ
jgi:type I restriction enzyme M protein